MITIVFRFKREKVINVWRKLHKEKSNNFYCSPNIIRMRLSDFWTSSAVPFFI
jgi:acyl-coenzyme A synthetase/AMP-(fatty) acid ligase